LINKGANIHHDNDLPFKTCAKYGSVSVINMMVRTDDMLHYNNFEVLWI